MNVCVLPFFKNILYVLKTTNLKSPKYALKLNYFSLCLQFASFQLLLFALGKQKKILIQEVIIWIILICFRHRNERKKSCPIKISVPQSECIFKQSRPTFSIVAIIFNQDKLNSYYVKKTKKWKFNNRQKIFFNGELFN